MNIKEKVYKTSLNLPYILTKFGVIRSSFRNFLQLQKSFEGYSVESSGIYQSSFLCSFGL